MKSLPELRVAIGLVLLLPATRALAADAAPRGAESAVLHLTNGGFVAGELKGSGAASRLGWQSPLFTGSFAFDVDGVNAVHFPLPPVLPRAQGDYRFELSQGDVLFGALVRWEGERLELDVPRIGRVLVPKTDVLRINRWRDSTDLVYLGPNGLAGWRTSSAAGKGWYEEFGHLTTDQDGASLRSDFELPLRAAIEFELSWKKRPDFVLALGAGDDDALFQQAWRFEVWDGDLVFKREIPNEADLAAVQKISAGPGRAHLYVYLDQEQGRCQVYSSQGEQLADLTLPADHQKSLAGVRLDNMHGGLRLERLRIARWAGALPREVQTDKPRVHRIDGSIAYGQVAGFNAATREFLLRSDDGDRRIAADLTDSVILSLTDDPRPPRSIRAMYQDGAQLSGELQRVDGGALVLAVPGIDDPLHLPVDGLRSLIVLRHDSSEAAGENGPAGLLELDGLRLRGRLHEGKASPGASCLVWQPLGSATAAALRTGISGKIVYREPPPRQAAQAQAAPGGRIRIAVANNGAVIRQQVVVGGGFGAPPVGAPQVAAKGAQGGNLPDVTGQRAMHLRTGDTIPCEVTAIDEEGVRIRTSVSDSTFVPHGKIKAVELTNESASSLRLNKIKRERLLTLPRMQKDSPPTHLVRSRNGDILRGRVVALDDAKLTIEVRLENKEIPRERIAQIIWLHADEFGETAAADRPAEKPAAEKPAEDKKKARWNPIEQRPGVRRTPAEEQIARSLDKPTDVDFLDLPLEDALTFLKEYHNINLVLDKAALVDAGAPLDRPVTLKSVGAAFREVLKSILESRDLTYSIENDALKIIPTEADDTPDVRPGQVAGQNPEPDPPGRTRVQVLRSDGIRLTFFAEQMADARLSGTSDVLGPCRVELSQVDQLLIGGAIEQAAAMLAFQQWKLHNAIEPKGGGDGDSGDGSNGLDSPLVGKAAPDFELTLLDGKRFRLTEARGRVIVLDFWATWCGPCIQAMPLVDAAVRDFADQGVQLVAVNLEETPKKITSMLERHKLDMTVALDRDGAVAGKYSATAIPQTVIIDRDGKIARLFVGGGPQVGDQIRDALRAVLGGDKGDPKGDPKTDPARASP
jgi:peroxiredoxin